MSRNRSDTNVLRNQDIASTQHQQNAELQAPTADSPLGEAGPAAGELPDFGALTLPFELAHYGSSIPAT